MHVAAGDVTGDGYADIIVGQEIGELVRVFSGSDYSVVASQLPYSATYAAGVHVAAGDVNGDGRQDVIVGLGKGDAPVRVYDPVARVQLVGIAPYWPGFEPIFDGAIAACTPAAGMTKNVDRALVQNMAIEATLAWPPSWGAPGDIRDDVTLAEITIDQLFPSSGTTTYLDIVTASGRQQHVLRQFTDSRAGHCAFSPAQIVSAIGAMRSWLATGVRPAASDTTLFPFRLGFSPFFNPGPWPF